MSPLNFCIPSFNAVMLSMSKWFVGSSNIKKFAPDNINLESTHLTFSPPDNTFTFFNASSPENINHSTFNHTLAKKMNKPFFMPNIPAFVMKLALGEMSSLVLNGSRIDATKIQEIGFKFQYPTLEKALEELIEK